MDKYTKTRGKWKEGSTHHCSSGFAYRKQYFHLVLDIAYNFTTLTAAGELPFNCPSIQVKTGLFRVFKKKKKSERAILICFHAKRGAHITGLHNDIPRDITLHHMANLHSRPKAGLSFIRSALKIRLQKHI